MKQGSNPNKRSRGRGGMGGKKPSRNQTFDSNGPDVRVRGNAHQVFEKYLALARDAYSQGDRISAENYYQHAEHYLRIINAQNANRPRPANGGNGAEAKGNGANGADGGGDENAGRRDNGHGGEADMPAEARDSGGGEPLSP